MNEHTADELRDSLTKAAKVAMLPSLFAMWLVSYRLGLPNGRHSGAGEVRKVPRAREDEMDACFARSEPALFDDVVTRWPALTKWTPEYLTSKIGDDKVIALRSTKTLGSDFLTSFMTQQSEEMTFRELLEKVFGGSDDEARYYLWGYKGLDSVTKLEADFSLRPEIGGRPLSRRDSGPWIGQKDNVTALHFDLWHGLLAQISGRKRVTLFAPTEAANLYTSSPFSLRAISTKLPPRCLQADPVRFPKVFQAPRYEAILEPGQMIYIPPFWWHEVEALDDNISFPIRYDTPLREQIHPGSFPMVMRQISPPVRQSIRKLRRSIGI